MPQGAWKVACIWLALVPAFAEGRGTSEPAAIHPGEQSPELPARVVYLQALEKLARGQNGSLQTVFALGRAAAREQLAAVLEWDKALADGKLPRKRFEPWIRIS